MYNAKLTLNLSNSPLIISKRKGVADLGGYSMLAELMLPDQAHVRIQDWTIFFLHKDAEREEVEVDASGHAPLIYVLNLVNTKHDKREKR